MVVIAAPVRCLGRRAIELGKQILGCNARRLDTSYKVSGRPSAAIIKTESPHFNCSFIWQSWPPIAALGAPAAATARLPSSQQLDTKAGASSIGRRDNLRSPVLSKRPV